MISPSIKEAVVATFPAGTEVALVSVMDDPNPVTFGATGTVRCVDDKATVHVLWDEGGSLGCIYGVDKLMTVSSILALSSKDVCTLARTALAHAAPSLNPPVRQFIEAVAASESPTCGELDTIYEELMPMSALTKNIYKLSENASTESVAEALCQLYAFFTLRHREMYL